MLIVKVFVNEKQIDELHIQNKGEILREDALYEYVLVKPKGIKDKIYHNRPLGWMPLVKKALELLIKKDK